MRRALLPLALLIAALTAWPGCRTSTPAPPAPPTPAVTATSPPPSSTSTAAVPATTACTCPVCTKLDAAAFPLRVVYPARADKYAEDVARCNAFKTAIEQVGFKKVDTNPGQAWQAIRHLGRYAPDVIVEDDSGAVVAVVEVEAHDDLVKHRPDSIRQWQNYSTMIVIDGRRPAFHLAVPTNELDRAREMLHEAGLDFAPLWTYDVEGR